ncbi:MAG: quinone oxidoreductase [Acidobacteria bacterium]|nr:quinone oxidoreductase [Acidobacteriota bacterium]
MNAIVVRQTGGPEQMQFAEVNRPQPGPGQALVRIDTAGVNFIDVYFRIGLYKADLPFTSGMEASGVVEAVGEGVDTLKPGDRVAYAMARGSYAEFAVVPAWQLVPVPDGVPLETAAAVMLQGMTAHYLTHSSFPLSEGKTCLVHAAAGGAGMLVVQLAKILGATVIGTVGTEFKEKQARAAGADHVIRYTEQDFEPEVKRITGGKGVDVVYDSVGQATFLKSLNCLRPRGMMVAFGQSSGAVEPLDPLVLNQKGSLFLTRPSLAHHCATREELIWRSGDLFRWMSEGRLTIRIDNSYALKDAAQAHIDLESRKTSGKLLLKP